MLPSASNSAREHACTLSQTPVPSELPLKPCGRPKSQYDFITNILIRTMIIHQSFIVHAHMCWDAHVPCACVEVRKSVLSLSLSLPCPQGFNSRWQPSC